MTDKPSEEFEKFDRAPDDTREISWSRYISVIHILYHVEKSMDYLCTGFGS
jgi:hypothetical protein